MRTQLQTVSEISGHSTRPFRSTGQYDPLATFTGFKEFQRRELRSAPELLKNVPVTERIYVQLRFEFCNVLNHPTVCGSEPAGDERAVRRDQFAGEPAADDPVGQGSSLGR